MSEIEKITFSDEEKVEAIYMRQASVSDSDKIREQGERCKALAKDPESVKIYSDIGYGAWDMIERPGFSSLLADVYTGKIKKVIVYSLDRFSRSMVDISFVIDFLENRDVELKTVLSYSGKKNGAKMVVFKGALEEEKED